MKIATAIPCKSITLEAVVIRADGSRQDLGAIAYYHRNPLMRAAYHIKRWLGVV